ncbi:putative peptidoglycan biosynthesis protein MurJ [Rickettsiales endosymbiont of Paramecium tredecaurelia]|nr:putative peptidoglycan biosynthesis protein MurJ [Candidatus Sarmatiella mevalonica]
MFRELFIASTLGTGLQSDYINLAFRLPNLFRKIFAEGALSNVFIPIFSSLTEESQTKAKSFFITTLILLCLALCILVCIMEVFMPEIILLIAPGFNLSSNNEVVLLCRITLPYLLFIAIIALINCVLNVYNRFFAFAISPAILSVMIMIIPSIAPNNELILQALAWAMPIAGAVQLFVIYLSYTRTPLYRVQWQLSAHSAQMMQFLQKMLPASTNAASTQLHLFLSQSLASFIIGGISVLSYADRIYQFPFSIIGGTLGTLALPILSKLRAQNMLSSMELTSRKLIKLCIFLALPASFGIIATVQRIVCVVYERGMFTALDTQRVSKVVVCFALGLPAFILTRMYNNIFYARQNISAPFKITLCSLAVNLLFSVCCLNYLQELSIALGTALGGWLQLALLLYCKKKEDVTILLNPTVRQTSSSSMLNFALHTLAASAIMYLALITFNFYTQECFEAQIVLYKTIIVVAQIAFGIGVFVLCSLLNSQFFEIKNIIQHQKK